MINILSLPVTGIYTVFVDTGQQGGKITLELSTTLGNGTIMVGGSPVTDVLPPGQGAFLNFSGSQGEQISLAGSNMVDCKQIGIQPPTGSVASVSMCGAGVLPPQLLNVTGSYTVSIGGTPSGGQVTVQLFNVATVTGSLAIDGSSATETLKPGQDALLTFAGTAGRGVALDASNNSLKCPSVSILGPDARSLTSSQICGSSGVVSSGSLPTTGTYSVLLDNGSQAGSISLKLASITPTGGASACNEVNGAISVSGTPVTENLNANQCAFLSFSGSLGEQVSLTGSNISLNCPTVTIIAPGNLALGSSQMCAPSGFIDALTLPSSGTYEVFVDNVSASQSGTITVALVNSAPATGTLTVGGPAVAVTLSSGQDALYTFSDLAGELMSLNAIDITLDCSSTLNVVDPNGVIVASQSMCATAPGKAYIEPLFLTNRGFYRVFIDTGATAGNITMTLNRLTDNASAVNVTDTYAHVVIGDNPWAYWRLDETGLSQALNASHSVSRITGPTTHDAAIGLNGLGSLFTVVPQDNPRPMSEEIWFKTSTTNGAELIGFCDQQFSISCNSGDRSLSLSSSGQLIFATFDGSLHTVQSSKSYNDGQWHYAVGTWSTNSLNLYVDGAFIGTAAGGISNFLGYWHIGANSFPNWPSQPSTSHFAGALAEAAVYNYALSPSQISNHFSDAKSNKYGLTILADNPVSYWKLNETVGVHFADSTGAGNTAMADAPSDDGAYQGGVTLAQPGVIATDNAALFDGSSGFVSGLVSFNSPGPFSEEVWFNTTTTSGGGLVGLCDHLFDNNCQNTDRILYMTNSGQVMFATYDTAPHTITSSASYNDGSWHYAVGTWANNTLSLYVDGKLINSVSGGVGNFPGYWHIGADNLFTYPSRPSSFYFAGTIDEPGIYSYALNATQVLTHYAASGR